MDVMDKELKVPKLRFKDEDGREFLGWEERKLGEVFDYIIDKGHFEKEVLTIKQGIGTVLRKASGIDIKYNQQSLGTYKLVQRNDFIVHLRSFQAGFEIANSEGIVSPAYTILRNKLPIAFGFYRAYFRTYNFINHNLNLVVEGIRDGRTINISELKLIKLPLPTLLEQRKIADFLSAYDELIGNQEKRVEALKLRKKGLLQKIFSQEIRFKDDEGREFPAWEERKLGEVVKEYDNRTIDDKEDILLSCTTNGVFLNSDIFSHQRGASTKGYKKIKLNTLILSCQNLHLGNANVNFKFISGLVSPAYKTYDIINADAYFVSQLIKVKSFYNLVDKCSNAGASACRKNIEWQSLYDSYLSFPTLPEQRKIADFLFVADHQITFEEKRLDTMRLIKKALLQQLFV